VASAHDEEFVLVYEGSTQLKDMDRFELANLLAAQKHLKCFAPKFFEEEVNNLSFYRHIGTCAILHAHTHTNIDTHTHTHTETHTDAHTHIYTHKHLDLVVGMY
jgi:hypothetical protein